MNIKNVILFIIMLNVMIGAVNSLGEPQLASPVVQSKEKTTEDWNTSDRMEDENVEPTDDSTSSLSFIGFLGKALTFISKIGDYAFGIPNLLKATFVEMPGILSITIGLKVLFSAAYGWLALEFFRGVKLD